jgi:hypothetical protein
MSSIVKKVPNKRRVRTASRKLRKNYVNEVLIGAVAGMVKAGADPAGIRLGVQRLIDNAPVWESLDTLYRASTDLLKQGVNRWEL